jgi:hypothetical protein
LDIGKKPEEFNTEDTESTENTKGKEGEKKITQRRGER